MKLDTLTAISPIDGRYRHIVEGLSDYFSEYALMKARLKVEMEYFISLSKLNLKGFMVNRLPVNSLRKIYTEFSLDDARRIKEIESVINHDVKSVEYFIKERLPQNLNEYSEFVHFGLTSQDVTNTAIPMLLQEAICNIVSPKLSDIEIFLANIAADKKNHIPMLSRTHGQPASPTTLNKEVMVFYSRLSILLEAVSGVMPLSAKFGGAIGNFNAHKVAYPDVDWVGFANSFIRHLKLKRTQYTTQVDNYDNIAMLLDIFKQINVVLIDMCQDIWHYISLGYFKQKINKDEVGSSTMPHKVNPIDFENAEGNLGIANALFEYMSRKLPVSRLQRDLTDSTVLRNLGVAFSHSYLAYNSIVKGLRKLSVNSCAINRDLDENWEVVSEGIQTILRREHFPEPYEKLKELTRTGDKISKENIENFINSLNVSDEVKEELLNVTPYNYKGIF